MKELLKTYLLKTTDSATLAFFRLAFGLMMFLGLVRFAANGWIEAFYIKPSFHFTFYGFDWVRPLGDFTYLLFIICGLASLGVAVGYKYRISIIVFFLSFTYIELMDKTTYLNHYYFVSVISFALIFLPANAAYSVDAFRDRSRYFSRIPAYATDILKLLLGVVYFYAGLAKINSDWLLRAMPLKIWLPNNMQLPLIGPMLNQPWAQYLFSWSGMFYDLLIPFLLLYRRTRIFAFVIVVVFHVLTRILFPIGLFPYIMIVSTLLFFEASFHAKVLQFLSNLFRIRWRQTDDEIVLLQRFSHWQKLKLCIIGLFIGFQILFPFRYLLYKDELFWTEEGFRFSWRVMLMEKAGYAEFVVTDPTTNRKFYINNSEYLTTFQEKQMSFQPDFILQYAHHLHDVFQKRGIPNPEVRVKSYVALNGRLSQLFIDPNIDLAKEYESFKHKFWILPFNDEIKGL